MPSKKKKEPPMERADAFVWSSPDQVVRLSKEELERIKEERRKEREKALKDAGIE